MSTPDVLLQASRQWSALLLLLHIGALGCVLFSGAPGWLQFAAIMACLCSLVICLRYAWLRAANAIVRLRVAENGQWRLQSCNGAVWLAELQGDSLVSRFLLVLNFKAASGRRRNRAVILMTDSTDACTLRRLRQYLGTVSSSPAEKGV